MTALLLDSHAYLWWLMDDPKLSRIAHQHLGDPSSIVFVSAATIWELSIKASLGRLDLGDADLIEEIADNGFVGLPVTTRHAALAGSLPPYHADPFDRMLIAQATLEDLACVTKDQAFDRYGVPLVW